MDLTIAKRRFRIAEKVGAGGCGTVHIGVDVSTGEQVAIKFSPIKSKSHQPILKHEKKNYKKLEGGEGIPKFIGFAQSGDQNALAVELLGPSLWELFEKSGYRFGVKTVLFLAVQLISRLEYIHSKGLLHRDIKPENFLMSNPKTSTSKGDIVHAIDFGFSSSYICPKTGDHIAFNSDRGFMGTSRYASTNAHYGFEQSRRDDMESLSYVLFFFLRGSLPWQGLDHSTHDKVVALKQSISPSYLCEGFPIEFAYFLTSSRSLKFEEEPDYKYWKKVFREVFRRRGFQDDGVYDWTGLKVVKGGVGGDFEASVEMLKVVPKVARKKMVEKVVTPIRRGRSNVVNDRQPQPQPRFEIRVTPLLNPHAQKTATHLPAPPRPIQPLTPLPPSPTPAPILQPQPALQPLSPAKRAIVSDSSIIILRTTNHNNKPKQKKAFVVAADDDNSIIVVEDVKRKTRTRPPVRKAVKKNFGKEGEDSSCVIMPVKRMVLRPKRGFVDYREQ